MATETVRVTTYVTKEEARALKILAINRDTSVAALIRDLIRSLPQENPQQ